MAQLKKKIKKASPSKKGTKKTTTQKNPSNVLVIKQERQKPQFPKKIIMWTAILLVLITIGGVVLSFFKKSVDNIFGFDWLFGKKEVEFVEADKKDSHLIGQSNGGLTIEEVITMRVDENRPYAEDVGVDFYIYETDHHVILVRSIMENGKLLKHNALFLKSDKGLIFDGGVGYSLEDVSTDLFTGTYVLRDATFKYQLPIQFAYELPEGETELSPENINSGVNYSSLPFSLIWNNFSPHFSVSKFNAGNVNVPKYKKSILGKNYEASETNRVFNLMLDNYSNKVLIPYFMSFSDVNGGNVELINGSNDGDTTLNLSMLNSFATYLFNQSKLKEPNIVLLDDYYNMYIKTSEVKNYPIAEEFLYKYPSTNYYTMFNNSIYANTRYAYIVDGRIVQITNSEIAKAVKDDVVAPIPSVVKEYGNVKINLINDSTVTINDIDISTYPVVIKINNNSIKFNTKNDLVLGKSIILPLNEDLEYEILSNGLAFNSYSGVVSFSELNNVVNLNFHYQVGAVETSVKINALTNIDLSIVNLASNPVKIIFNHKTSSNTYIFDFNSNDLINTTFKEFMKVGDYDYTILSNQLIFATNNGEVTISESDRVLVFNFGVNTSVSVPIGMDVYYVNDTLSYNPFNAIFHNDFGALSDYGALTFRVDIYNSDFTVHIGSISDIHSYSGGFYNFSLTKDDFLSSFILSSYEEYSVIVEISDGHFLLSQDLVGIPQLSYNGFYFISLNINLYDV